MLSILIIIIELSLPQHRVAATSGIGSRTEHMQTRMSFIIAQEIHRFLILQGFRRGAIFMA